ncbi:MAG: aminoacyl-tRNA hydrolase [Candidatus Omnitrophica bacterium]|nr:aminoacyl-tRNA hydrolase [Candidatus Omnitrophota bacterium]
MKLILGLGNPGKKYINNRHNLGFMVVDRIVNPRGLKFKKFLKLKSRIARDFFDAEEVIFAKPYTFMNNSGKAAKSIIDACKIPENNRLVVYDDMDLDLGMMKFTRKGSCAGHRGMGSIIESLGSEDIPRFRIGISKSPENDSVNYVLSDYPPEEREILDKVLDRAKDACLDWIKFGLTSCMQKYNVKNRSEYGKEV